MTPKLPPTPPLMAQKRSSPMDSRSRTLPLDINYPSINDMIHRQTPPPLRCPPTPTVGQTPAGKPCKLLFSQIR
uniref:Uncharacterized protein n=1 Tax=Kalanchoe fedtschenkoi TaxID=63787 RepID=A0A7N0REN4_KALFE